MGGSLCCCGEGCCPDEPESTHRFRAHMRRDPDLPPEGQLYTGFFYLQEWQWPSVTSWDLIRAAHSTFSAIQEYMARDSLLKKLRRKSRDEDAAEVQAEEQAEEKDSTEDLQEKPPWKVKEAWREQESATVTNQIIPEAVVARRKRTGGLGAHVKRRFKFLSAELPREKSTEEVLAVFKRDSAFQSSGPMEGPVEKFIYESDEEAPRQWQVRPPAVVTEKAGGLPEEKGSRKEPLEDSNKGSAEDASQYLKVPTRPLPAPPEKAKETNPEQAEEIKPSELKEDENAEEPDSTCSGFCTSWWKSLKICQPPEGPKLGRFPWPVSPLDRASIGESPSSVVFFGLL
uniref:uncharacterized protein LOC106999053 isoform X2 n=1 Tax=Macaca mulatta TaxID=9544 RepID=UPI0010A20BF0|nr:uncharacterized protein LOC106999053 isoform X2 [Macaca mulatta]